MTGLHPLPPSRFHDQAYRRDAGHDVMQAEFLDWLRGRPMVMPPNAAVHRHVEGEYALRRRGQIVSYVDAIEIVTVNLSAVANLFEIKPRIETVFGIVRQAKALLDLAQGDIRADQHYCHVVVKAGDPLLPELRKHWRHVWAWGARFEPIEDEGADERN